MPEDPRRRLPRGRDEGHRVVGAVGLLGRGLDGADRLGDHPGPQVAGPSRVLGAVRRSCGPVAGTPGQPARRRRWVPRGGRFCAGGGCWPSTGSRSTCPTRGQRRRVRLRRVRGEPLGVPEGAGGRVGRVRHPRVRRRRGRRLLRRGEDPGRSGCIRGCAPRSCSPPTGLLLLAGLGHRRRDRGGAAVAGPDPAGAAGRAGAVRRHLPGRVDQTRRSGAGAGTAAGRRPRRRRICPTSTPCPARSTSGVCRSSTWPGSSSTTSPTGSATAPAS